MGGSNKFRKHLGLRCIDFLGGIQQILGMGIVRCDGDNLRIDELGILAFIDLRYAGIDLALNRVNLFLIEWFFHCLLRSRLRTGNIHLG